jgi:hypothetical protein
MEHSGSQFPRILLWEKPGKKAQRSDFASWIKKSIVHYPGISSSEKIDEKT